MSEVQTRELLTAEQLSAILEEKIAQVAPQWLAEQPDLHERLVEVLADDPEQLLIPPMSYEEFLAWATDLHAEWVEGKVLLMSPASGRHQDISMFLSALLHTYVVAHQLGIVRAAPFQMRLHQPPRGREPDLLFIAKDNLWRSGRQYLDGPADLVIEIISPESSRRDRDEKFHEYEIAGVPEYWLIDPEREQVWFYQLNEQGRYTLIMDGQTGQYTSLMIPGLTIDVSWFWQEPLPPVWTLMPT